jgi:membrane protease YdiL (CAAX protease family)
MSITLYPLPSGEPRNLSTKKKRSKSPVAKFFSAPFRTTVKLFTRSKVLRPHIGLAVVATTAVIGSQATLIWEPRVGLFVDVATFILLTVLSLMRPLTRPTFISLAVLPVANLVSSSFITNTLLMRTTVFYVSILVLSQLYRYFFALDAPLTSTKLTARGYGFALPAMVVLGQGLGLIGYAFLHHQYMYKGVSLPLMAGLSVVFAFCEEIFLRGLVQQQAAKLFHPAIAAVMTAGIYAFLALSHQTLLTLGPAIFTGILLSITYYKKQNLILTVTMNAAAKLTYLGLLASFVLK